MSRRRNGQKGARTGQSTGLGTGSAGSVTWNSSNHLTPVFAEGTNMSVGGPSSSKNMPRRLANSKSGTGPKFGDKLWTQKAPGLFTQKEKTTSSPNRARPLVDDFERVVTNLRQVNKSGPSLQASTTFPSSVKGKKSLARNRSSKTPTKCAANPCVEGSFENISITSLTHPPLPQSESNHPSCATFEFSAKSNAETNCLDGSENVRSMHTHQVGEKRSYSMDDAPKDSNLEVDLQSSAGVQLANQSLVSEDRSMAGD